MIYKKTEMKEMPKGCLVCSYFEAEDTSICAGYCNGEVICNCECSEEKRYDRCPLVEVKENKKIPLQESDFKGDTISTKAILVFIFASNLTMIFYTSFLRKILNITLSEAVTAINNYLKQ